MQGLIPKHTLIGAAGIEKEISMQKNFYLQYLLDFKGNRSQVVQELNKIIAQYDKLKGETVFHFNQDYYNTERNANDFLKLHWGNRFDGIFNAEVEYEKPKRYNRQESNILAEFFIHLSSTIQEDNAKRKAQLTNKSKFLNLLKECLQSFGLADLINQRDERIFKRYNVVVWYKLNREDQSASRILMSHKELEEEFLIPFHKKSSIILGGHIIKKATITKVLVTTTLLWHRDELELFSKWKKIQYSDQFVDEFAFAYECLNETNKYFKEPVSKIKNEISYKNGCLTFINQTRIEEIKAIKCKFDLARLVKFCEDLNTCSTLEMSIPVASLTRSIINFIPPIFEHDNFAQVVANYPFGKSVKSSLNRLQTSMKDVADYNLHSQAAKSDSLPNMTTVDFSPELDVLLSEVIKILKLENLKK
jgi:hypothetical protein